jgi:hypothetical protein
MNGNLTRALRGFQISRSRLLTRAVPYQFFAQPLAHARGFVPVFRAAACSRARRISFSRNHLLNRAPPPPFFFNERAGPAKKLLVLVIVLSQPYTI